MKGLLVVLIAVSGFVVLQAQQQVVPADARIVGGYPAFVGQFPWQARVVGSIWCGAVLIDRYWVLTMEYCTKEANELTVYLGGVTTLENEEGKVAIKTATFFTGYDIAIIYLPNGVDFTDRIRPIRLPESNEVVPIGSRVVLSGYGRRTQNTSDPSGLLHYINLDTISNEECAATWGNYITEYTLCTKGDLLNSPCNGDGGGPLVFNDCVSEPTLHGLLNFIGGCGGVTNPVGYIRIQVVSDYIREVTGIP